MVWVAVDDDHRKTPAPPQEPFWVVAAVGRKSVSGWRKMVWTLHPESEMRLRPGRLTLVNLVRSTGEFSLLAPRQATFPSQKQHPSELSIRLSEV